MAFEFKAVRRVEFSETDMAGIVHYSNFFRFMETAEHAFYRSLGFSVILDQFDPPLGFPRVHAECDFKRPIRFEDEVEIHLLVKEKRSRVITYFYRFTNLGGSRQSRPERVLAATGFVTVVCVAHLPNGRMEAATIPDVLGNLIDLAPSHLLEI